MKILLIDDGPLYLRAATRLLRLNGYHPLPYHDPISALAEDFSSIDAVITDLRMPTSGEEVIRSIRDRGLTLPIIVVSGYLIGRTSEHLMANGVQGVLAKPYDASQLLDLVTKVLGVV